MSTLGIRSGLCKRVSAVRRSCDLWTARHWQVTGADCPISLLRRTIAVQITVMWRHVPAAFLVSHCNSFLSAFLRPPLHFSVPCTDQSIQSATGSAIEDKPVLRRLTAADTEKNNWPRPQSRYTPWLSPRRPLHSQWEHPCDSKSLANLKHVDPQGSRPHLLVHNLAISHHGCSAAIVIIVV